VTHAVQHRKDHGLGSHRSTEIVHGTGKSVALNAQQDYVIGSGDAVSGNGFRMYRQISMWTDDLESFCVYLFRSLGANEKRDVAVRLDQAAAKISANGACPDNQDSHY
jgi:hypothetical protein